MKNGIRIAAALGAVSALGVAGFALAQAQAPAPVVDPVQAAIEVHRAMLAEANPADLYAMRGEELWRTPRGPRNASLERCDLGKGPGVLEGAFVELPRFFPDTGRVQDLESRILTCMQTLQGLDTSVVRSRDFLRGETANVVAMATFVSSLSTGMRVKVPQTHPAERTMYEVGQRIFFWRAGTHDFSCSTCHAVQGQRIRLQDLPVLAHNPGDGVGFAAMPKYRVSSGQMWSMQHRLHDCFRQMRWPEPQFASDAVIALSTFLGVRAKDSVTTAPSIRR